MAAKRSDFAQKLLDDLRLRKERMAATEMSSHSNTMAGAKHAYGQSQQTLSGSGRSRSHGTPNFTGNLNKKSNGGHRFSGEVSTQMVPFGKNQTSEQLGNLSMALSLAFQNGGNFRKMDSSSSKSVLGFLHQIGRRTKDLRKPERSSSFDSRRHSSTQFPNLSHLQVKEISKGAQKLNEIRKACSNGINIDKYSIEIGKELLKGAVDLEESLRMLVSLQEASDYIVSPQRKSKVELVEVDGDEDEDTVAVVDKKQLDLPRFSFDKPSRSSYSSQLQTRNGGGKHTSEAPISSQEKQASVTSKSSFHKRSASAASDFITPKQSKTENGRIPSVVAKLMGLEELPESTDFRSKPEESTPRRKIDGNVSARAAEGSTARTEVRRSNSDRVVQQSAREQLRQGEQTLDIHSPNFNVMVYAGKSPLKDYESIEGVKQMRGSQKAKVEMSKHRRDGIDTPNQHLVSRGKSDAARGVQEKPYNSDIMLQTNKRNGGVISHDEDDQTQALQPEKQLIRQKLPLTKQKRRAVSLDSPKPSHAAASSPQEHAQLSAHNRRNHTRLTDASPSKQLSDSREEEDLAGERSPMGLRASMSFGHNASPRDEKTDLESLKLSASQEDEKLPTRNPSVQRGYDKKVPNRESPRKIDEWTSRKSEKSRKLTIPLNSKLQEAKQTRRGKGGEVRAANLENHRGSIKASTRSTRSISTPIEAENVENLADHETAIRRPIVCDGENLQESPAPISNITCQHITGGDPDDNKQEQATITCRDEELNANYVMASPLNGTQERGIDQLYPPELLHRKKPKSWRQEPLTENENSLKQILTKSQVFLNCAEALFNLNIPVDVLHAGSNSLEHENSKLVLDCGYEVMKRKGKRLELSAHPSCIKAATSCSIESLDELVKHLHKDTESLRFYGSDERIECDASDYLFKMLEKDVQEKDPDLNCMWDLGWNETVFAYVEKDQVIRDVEKHMLNGLLDEITSEFLPKTIPV